MDSDSEVVPGRGMPGGDRRNESVSGRGPDGVSELDQRIIVALQQDGRASWRAIAESVGSSTATVARRGQQLLKDGILKIAVVPALGSRGPVDLFLIRINCRPGMQTQVAEALVANPDVRFVTMVTGRFDIIAEIVMRGGATQYPRLMQEVQSIEGVRRWRSDLILHVYKVSSDWSRQLFAETVKLPGGHWESRSMVDADLCSPEHFDEHDHEILAALRDDGRVAFNSIANELGVNESSVRRRFDRMRQNACIDILTLVPAAALGMGAEVLITVTVSPGQIDSVAHSLAGHSAVRYLAATLDGNSLFCEVITASVPELYGFINNTLSQLDGVQGWSASMELLFLKRGFVETPWSRTSIDRDDTERAAIGESLVGNGARTQGAARA